MARDRDRTERYGRYERERLERYSEMSDRSDETRRVARRAIDRDRVRDMFRAAGAREVDDEAVDAAIAVAAERLSRLATRAAEVQDDVDEDRLSAGSVAVAAAREAEERRERR